jgi:hypothetical protein
MGVKRLTARVCLLFGFAATSLQKETTKEVGSIGSIVLKKITV